MANDIFSTLRTYLSKVSEGEKSPAEIAAAINIWVRESGEALKSKIEDEVESSVSKMGFVKREEFDDLKRRFDEVSQTGAPKKTATKKTVTKKATAKTSPAKKSTVKKVRKSA
jgi:BMFP domain-containing protein YqiC